MFKSRVIVLASAVSLAMALSALPASAQFLQTSPVPKPTYGASVVGLANAATATDVMTLSGSATKLITITSVQCSGTAAAAATADIVLVKRTTANVGGTSTNTAIASFDSKTPAATGVVKSYTANPTTLGTSSGIISALKLNLPVVATTNSLPATFSMTDFPYTFPIVLRGVGESLAINGNATLGVANLDCSINWTEQ